jgi:SAM-dependent methyltransferase
MEKRLSAAEASGGISSDAIYACIEQLILKKDLKGKIFDYGAGMGHMTRKLLACRRFEHVAAADIRGIPSDLEGIVEWIQQDLNVPLIGHDEAFSTIVAVEVIEHLENPRMVMRELTRTLIPGGTIILTTPNNESLRSLAALLVRGHYVAFSDSCYPAHITALLRKDFLRIFGEVGLLPPEFYFSDVGGIPGKPNITWQRVSFGLLCGLRFSDNIVAVARKPYR